MNDIKEMVIESLNRADQQTIERRAERMMQISPLIISQSRIGEDELLSMVEEARVCYINGLNISTLIVASSCIERMLITELKHHNAPNETFQSAIKKHRETARYPEGLLNTVDSLRVARNAYVHNKPNSNKSRRVNRAMAADVAPTTISEDDALSAIKTMYKLFNTLFREAPVDQLDHLTFSDTK